MASWLSSKSLWPRVTFYCVLPRLLESSTITLRRLIIEFLTVSTSSPNSEMLGLFPFFKIEFVGLLETYELGLFALELGLSISSMSLILNS
jgi:hypothetical protein